MYLKYVKERMCSTLNSQLESCVGFQMFTDCCKRAEITIKISNILMGVVLSVLYLRCSPIKSI